MDFSDRIDTISISKFEHPTYRAELISWKNTVPAITSRHSSNILRTRIKFSTSNDRFSFNCYGMCRKNRSYSFAWLWSFIASISLAFNRISFPTERFSFARLFISWNIALKCDVKAPKNNPILTKTDIIVMVGIGYTIPMRLCVQRVAMYPKIVLLSKGKLIE